MKKFILISILIGLVTGVLLFQNCSRKKSTPEDTQVSVLSSKTKAIHWRYTSGTVAPNYQFDVEYDLDFQSKVLTISSIIGSSATGHPSSQTKYISDLQLSQILTLLDKISFVRCPEGIRTVGGGTDEVGIYTTSVTTADILIYHSNCTGYSGAIENQETSGYTDLTNYLKNI